MHKIINIKAKALGGIPVKDSVEVSEWLDENEIIDFLEQTYNWEVESAEIAITQFDYVDEEGNKSIVDIVGKDRKSGKTCPTSIKIPSCIPDYDVHEYLLNNFDWEVESFCVEKLSIVDKD